MSEPGPPRPSRLHVCQAWIRERLQAWFLTPWRELDGQVTTQAPDADQRAIEARLAFFLAAICLTLVNYLGNSFSLIFPAAAHSPHAELLGRGWWSLCCDVFYLGVPLVWLLVRRKSPWAYGLSPRGFFAHVGLYGTLFAAILPAVIAVSFTQPFQELYPFHRQAGRSWFDFLAWEILYALQFVTLEFFFRGWLLFSLRPALGANAIFAMMVPYCMIHFGKPFLETLGAIGAGLILGTLALRTGSIWLGAALHIAVAWTMDVLSLLQQGKFPPGGN